MDTPRAVHADLKRFGETFIGKEIGLGEFVVRLNRLTAAYIHAAEQAERLTILNVAQGTLALGHATLLEAVYLREGERTLRGLSVRLERNNFDVWATMRTAIAEDELSKEAPRDPVLSAMSDARVHISNELYKITKTASPP